MNLLLDTNVWLWLQHSPERLGDAIEFVEDPENILYLSAASSWEIAIKWSIGKLPLPVPPRTYVPDRMASSGVLPLPVHHAHTLAVAGLPRHHRDPFDRLLIAQSQLEGARLVTSDEAMRPYEADFLWVG